MTKRRRVDDEPFFFISKSNPASISTLIVGIKVGKKVGLNNVGRNFDRLCKYLFNELM